MHHRNRFAYALVPSLLVGLSISGRASADEKEACLTSADQGQSLRDDGRYLSARDEFLACARPVCPKLVHDQCTEWLRQLDEATPTVVFGAKDEHGGDITSARVLSDGKLITSNLDGKPVPLDPGPHDIRFERDPNESVTVHVVLRTGEKNREISATMPGADGATPPAEGTTPATATGAHFESSSIWNGRTITSLSLLVGAAAAVGVGAFFGVQSQNEKSTADGLFSRLGRSGCSIPSTANQSTCDSLGRTRDSQNGDAVLNEVFYVAGGVLAVGAVATWFLWPKPQEESRANTAWVAPMIGSSHAGLRVGGDF